ncbi:MAG: hypothetical protein NVS1B7_5620 [Candidatus Saccharimonadales bacterium]
MPSRDVSYRLKIGTLYGIIKLLTSKLKMNKQKLKLETITRLLAYGSLTLFLIMTSLLTPSVKADQFDQQISTIKEQTSQTQGAVDQLQLQANSYQDAIARLNQQIIDIQASIRANIARQADLQKQIAAAELELENQRRVLGEDIKTMYLEGQISTLEMLASSKDLSQFVDKQQYRTSVQDKIKSTVDKITALKISLKSQKEQVDQLLQTQKQQQAQLAADQAQQAQLLALNQQQQDQYNQQIKENASKIASLRAQQAAANAAIARAARVNMSSGGSGGSCDVGQGNGGYSAAGGSQGNPCSAAQDSIPDWAYDARNVYIPNRECTSYAYWYMNQVEGKAFSASGNAKQWIYTSSRPVDRTPEVGAIGVWPNSAFGHVMIIQAVGPTTYGGTNVPAGEVMVSNMNFDYNGHFSYNLWPINSLYFIH